MRIAQNQAFYGQVVGFLDIMKVSVFIVLEWKTFENADWSKLETPNRTKLLWFISRSFAWFAEFLSCFLPPLQDISRLFGHFFAGISESQI